MNKYFGTITVAILLNALLSSCVGGLLNPKKDESQFYILKSIETESSKTQENKPISVNFLPVAIPSYMSGRQIVSLDDKGNLDISEFNRWGERPEDSFSRAISENISKINPKIDIYEYPSVSFANDNIAMRIVVNECIGRLGKDLSFVATWQLSTVPENRDLVLGGKFRVKVKCGVGYDGYIKAMEDAIEKLSEKVCAALVDLNNKANQVRLDTEKSNKQ